MVVILDVKGGELMTPEEKAKRKAAAEAEMKQRYDDAVDIVLAKRRELGRMPTERDFKKDSTVNLEQLIKDLGCESFSGVVIKVLHEQRQKEGQPDEIVSPKGRELQKLKIIDPEKYDREMARKAEKKKEFKAKGRRIAYHSTEEREAKRQKAKEEREEFRRRMIGSLELPKTTKKKETEVKKMEQSIAQEAKAKEVAQKEAQEITQEEILKKPARGGRKRWTDKEIASVIKEIMEEYHRCPTDAELITGEIDGEPIKSKTPSPMTVRRALGGYRKDWPSSIERILDCKLDTVVSPRGKAHPEKVKPKTVSIDEAVTEAFTEPDEMDSTTLRNEPKEIVQNAIGDAKEEIENISQGTDLESRYGNYQVLDFKDFSEEVKKCLQIIDDGSLIKVSEAVAVDVRTKICARNIGGTRVNCYFILQTEE